MNLKLIQLQNRTSIMNSVNRENNAGFYFHEDD